MKKFIPLVLVLAPLVLAGCLSTHRSAPDELAVIEGPPLWLPPDYDLRPPSEAGPATTADQRNEQTTAEQPPAADSWLLDQAGADKRDPTIRRKLEQDNQVVVEEKKRGWLRRKLWPGNTESTEE